MAAPPLPFPESLDKFSEDERVYQPLDSKEWHLEDENGLDWEFVPNIKDPSQGTWRQAVCSHLTLTNTAYTIFQTDKDEDARNEAKFLEQFARQPEDDAFNALTARNEKKRQAEEDERVNITTYLILAILTGS